MNPNQNNGQKQLDLNSNHCNKTKHGIWLTYLMERMQLVVNGFSNTNVIKQDQSHKDIFKNSGFNYDEVFAPVTKYNWIRTALAIAKELDMEIHQMDVETAFLNGAFKEEVYMQQPDGFVNKDHPEMICQLRKNLYGQKQAVQC